MDTYEAGTWLEDMHLGLLWSSARPGASKTASYVAPSWSWASLNFDQRSYARHESLKVIYERDLHNYGLTTSNHAAQILDVLVRNIDEDPFGQVPSSSLTIRAPYQRICLCNIPYLFLDCHSSQDSPAILFETVAHNRSHTEAEKISLQASEICNVRTVAEAQCNE